MGKYKVNVVSGSLIDISILDPFDKKKIEDFGDEWGCLFQIEADIKQIKNLQKAMIKHYENSFVPWYMDGFEIKNSDNVICAFGFDDGEKGKIFRFNRNDKKSYEKVREYGISKGIPPEQMDFLDKQ